MLPRLLSASFAGALLLCTGAILNAQESGGFELHAHGKVTPENMGLPAYPGAQLFKQGDGDPTVDMGFTAGDTHFRLLAASYASGDSPEQILKFYRKPLARYGEVLECDHGHPVGSLKETRSGLRCDSQKDDKEDLHGTVDSSNDHELRSGTPERFRIVGVDEKQKGRTKFGLVYVELPKDKSGKSD
jgi:hypothetical protein